MVDQEAFNLCAKVRSLVDAPSGSSSVEERFLAKKEAVGSNPISRSSVSGGMAYTLDLGSSLERGAGSTPVLRTNDG